jgi:hypothetical protein
MSRPRLIGASSVLLALGIVAAFWHKSTPTEPIFDPKVKTPEGGPLCPWREPASDLKLFFLNATRYEVETRILSGLRVELASCLGRGPTGDENALHIWHVYQENALVGSVLTRRVKGEHGAIELVLAVDSQERVRGIRLQRLREPEPIARALQNSDWLRSFEGKRADNMWKLGEDVPDVPSGARASASAVVEGARSLLILLSASSQAIHSTPAAAPHH